METIWFGSGVMAQFYDREVSCIILTRMVFFSSKIGRWSSDRELKRALKKLKKTRGKTGRVASFGTAMVMNVDDERIEAILFLENILNQRNQNLEN